MSNDKSPAFQFYPSDFLSDKNTMLMSAEEIGMYMLLMCVCWKEGSLPDDMEEMAVLSRANSTDFEESWNKRISKCFVREGDEWIHPRLEKERRKQHKYRQKKVEAGKKGARKRWENTDSEPKMADDSSAKNKNGTANGSPMANDSSSSSTSTSESNTRTHAKPPDKEEVVKYFDEKGYSKSLAEKFYSYYQEPMEDRNGRVWKDQNGKTVKSWKQKAIAVWMNDDEKEKPEKSPFRPDGVQP